MFDQLTITHGFRQRTVCVRPPCTNVSTQKTVCDIHTNGNVFPGFTVWDVHTYENDFLGFTVWDVHTYGNDWVSMPRPIAHGPSLCPRRAYPRRFLGRVGRTPPYRPHSLGDGSKCRRGKGLKTVCLGPTRTSDTLCAIKHHNVTR